MAGSDRATAWLSRLGIESREGTLVLYAGTCLALLGFADASVQNVSETFFLKRVGVKYLPLAFLVSSLLLVATTYGIGRYAAPRNRPKLLWRVFLYVSLALLPLWLLVRLDVPGAVVLLILSAKQIEATVLIVFWVAMGDLLHGRQAKRLYAPLMSGVTLGAIVGSFSSDPVGRLIGIENLLLFCAVVLGLGSLSARPLRKIRPPRLERGLRDAGLARVAGAARDVSVAAIPTQVSLGELWRRSELFRLLLLATLCAGFLGPMLYFQFSYVADIATAGQRAEQRLLALYSQFRGWINLLVLIAQVSLTARLYRWLGVPLAAAVSPTIYLLGFFGLSVRLNLPAGIAAVAAARLQDEAIGDPAMRVLFNLFPDSMRARAASLLDPIKRAGGALGNVAVLLAITFGSALWVGYIALPIAALWLVVVIFLWRAYPNLLLAAAAGRGRMAGDGVAQLVDAATVRFLSAQLLDADAGRCRAAIELLSDARPEEAMRALARAARLSANGNRAMLVRALDDLLASRGTAPASDEDTARSLAELLGERDKLGDRERAAAVRAFGRLSADPSSGAPVLDRALHDPVPAVRLAALAALHRHGNAPTDAPDMDAALASAVRGEDILARRVAVEELRALLLGSDSPQMWDERLALLVEVAARPLDRLIAAEALADVAERHGERVRSAARALLPYKQDEDVQVRAVVLRVIGRAGLTEQAPWLVEHVGSNDEREATAAREGLLALGPRAANAMMVQHSFGKRSTRNAILSIVREFEVDKEMLRQLYRGELDLLRRTLVTLGALSGGSTWPIVLQRVDERFSEGVHTAMLFLTAIHDEDRIAELDELLRRTRSERQHAILLEALEVFLTPEEKAELVPLLEDSSIDARSRAAATALGIAMPSFEEASHQLLDDADDLTRSFAAAAGAAARLDAGVRNGDDGRSMSPVEIALQIKSNPIFERLTTRQLMDLARVVREETYAAGELIFQEGAEGSCMYLIVEGDVGILKGEQEIAQLHQRDFFGELALFEGVQRSATVVAKTALRLLRLERQDLLSLIEELPAIAIGICQSLARRVRDTSNRAVAR